MTGDSYQTLVLFPWFSAKNNVVDPLSPAISRRRRTSASAAAFGRVRPVASSQVRGASRLPSSRLFGGAATAVTSASGSRGMTATRPGRSPPNKMRSRSRGVPMLAPANRTVGWFDPLPVETNNVAAGRGSAQ